MDDIGQLSQPLSRLPTRRLKITDTVRNSTEYPLRHVFGVETPTKLNRRLQYKSFLLQHPSWKRRYS